MKTLMIAAAAAVALSLPMGVMAQTAAPSVQTHDPVRADAVGQWLYNQQGQTIGSVRRLADSGQTAVIMIGSYLRPGSYETRVPANDLSMVNGKVTLQQDTLLALNVPTRR